MEHVNMLRNLCLLLCATFLISACSPTTSTIRSHSTPSVNLSQYKTFGFFEKLDTDERYESLLSQYLKTSTTTEMTQRGFVLSNDEPDLLINFSRNITDKQEVYNRPRATQGAYYTSRGRIAYDTWIEYEPYLDSYQQGVLTIDIVDRKQNKVVWQGVAEGRLDQETQSNLQLSMPKLVSDIFKEFPIVTGLGQ